MVKVDVLGKPLLDMLRPAVDAGPGPGLRVTSSGTGLSGPVHFGWHNTLPRLVVTSDTDNFDEEILEDWKEEGFQVAYLPYGGDKKAYHNKLQHLADPLDLGDKYAIVGE